MHKRPNTPTNAVKMKRMPIEEVEMFLPMPSDWVLTGAVVSPKDGSLVLTVRQDGHPEGEKRIGGGRLYVAIDLDREEIEQCGEDILNYFKARGKAAAIGFYPAALSAMKILRSWETEQES